jgi:hypothetical protein
MKGIQMTRIHIPPGKMRTIEKEAAGSEAVLQQLCRESIVRIWLKANGIPSWRNPVTPSKESTDSENRYSIILANGSRFLVCPYRHAVLSFDRTAAAGCFAAVAVEIEENCLSGTVKGAVFLKKLPLPVQIYDFSTGGLEPALFFMHYLNRPAGYFYSLLKFSTRLLILGEPFPPERDTIGVRTFPAEKPGKREANSERQNYGG